MTPRHCRARRSPRKNICSLKTNCTTRQPNSAAPYCAPTCHVAVGSCTNSARKDFSSSGCATWLAVGVGVGVKVGL